MRVVRGLEGPWRSSWGICPAECWGFLQVLFCWIVFPLTAHLEKNKLLFTNTRPSSCRAETYPFTPQYLASSQLHICFLPPGLSHLRQEALTAYFPSCQLQIGSGTLIPVLCCYRDLRAGSQAIARAQPWLGAPLHEHGQVPSSAHGAVLERAIRHGAMGCIRAGETAFLGVWLPHGFFSPFSGGHRLYPFAYLPLICQMGWWSIL